jgi:23S rRNA pseudouridine955/2504/2580 synthase/23S rRNA pseudouridine1911/1915/1917 synthase
MEFFPKNQKHLNHPFRGEGSIIFENERFVAINKPAGLLTIPDRHNEKLDSVYKIFQQQYQKIFIVHRLDRDTSGIILFAKDEATHKFLSQLFEQRNVEKYYQGIIQGTLQNKKGVIDEPIAEHHIHKGMMAIDKRGKPSITEYEVLEDYGIYSLVQFKILTGRTHQIRVHMKHLGHPITGDELYGDAKPILLSSFKKKFKLSKHDEEERPLLSRLALHSYQLKFKDQNNKKFELEAELPKDMRALLQQLRKNRK